MKLKYIFIIIGAIILLGSLMSFSYSHPGFGESEHIYYKGDTILFAIIGLGLLLVGIFWKKS